MLFDSHAHYDSHSFDADRDALLSAMREHGVGRILNAGCDLPSSRAAVELANRYDFIWAAVGSHPDDADHVDNRTLDEYRALAAGELAAYLKGRGATASPCGSLQEGIGRALAAAGSEGLVCVCGSLYTIGEARHLLGLC